MRVIGCLMQVIVFLVVFVLLVALPPLGAALLTGLIWTNYFLQKGNTR